MEKSTEPTASPDLVSVPVAKRPGRWPAVLAALILILAAGAAVAYQPLADYYTLKDASPQMVKLAQQAGMNRAGELLFLRTHPQLDSDQQIIKDCPAALANQNGYIEQGCYNTAANRIYLRKMPANLHQDEVVTAAYELLHPAYLSLARTRQSALNGAIEQAYRQKLPDAGLSNLVALFAKTEPGGRDLELFSLLGTGYTNLPADLKQYYTPDFTDLAKVVVANNAIQALFQGYQSQLDALQATITADKSQADTAYAQSVNAAEAGNAGQDELYYNQYKQDIASANAIVGRYNQVLVGYNALVVEYNGTQPTAPLPALGSQPGQ